MSELDELDQLAEKWFRRGRLDRTRELCEQILRRDPERLPTRERFALALAGSGLHADGAAQLAQVIARQPENVALRANLGIMLAEARDFVPAIDALQHAVRLAPGVALIHYNLANTYGSANDLDNAAASYRRALTLDPMMAVACNNLGVIERRRGNVPEAIRCFETAIGLDPQFAAAHGNLGCAKVASGKPWEGINSLKQAALLQPTSPVALRDITQALVSVDEFQRAFTLYEHALTLHPNLAELHLEYGASLLKCGLTAESLPRLERALTLDPSLAEAHLNRASALLVLMRLEEADASIQRAVALDPSLAYALSTQFTIQRSRCDWTDLTALEERLTALAWANPSQVHPYTLFALTDDPELQRHVARSYVPVATPPPVVMPAPRERLRVAYLSGDLREHPVGQSIVELLEKHDRERFEIIGVSLIAEKHGGSPIGGRIAAACERFIKASQVSDAAILTQLRDLEITILVDLIGYTFGDRPFILAARPAPVIVSYLGYPGTRGLPCVDYLLADRHVIPREELSFYDEQTVWLPNSFFPSDTTLEPLPTRSRTDEGLPEEALVLCGFCSAMKLTPTSFDSWMRVMLGVANSVLWLQSGNEGVRDTLRRAAAARGVDPTRLIFADRLESRGEYLGRLQLADLFLDTWPYNGHSTVRDALWAGLPVLSRAGRGFASRVAASLLLTLGLDELVVSDQETYEFRALELAREPQRLRDLRARLALAHARSPLFDTTLLCRHVEAAYLEMAARARRGLPPAHFAVQQGIPSQLLKA